MNTVSLTGRLTRDVTYDQYERGGGSITVGRFALAVDRGRHDGADFIDIVTFGSLATTCSDHIAQGHLVAVTGRLHQARWITSGGDNRSRLEVIAERVDFLARPAAQLADAA